MSEYDSYLNYRNGIMAAYGLDYYLNFGHHNDNIGTVLRHIDRLRNAKNVCVVPCGYGQIIGWCLGNSIKCVGYDISPFMVDMTQFKNNVFEKNILDIDDKDEFDVIVCLDLLEHLIESEIETVIDKLRDAMTDDGVAIVRVGTDMLPSFYDDPTHKTRQSMEWWVDIFKTHGLYMTEGPTEIGEFVFRRGNAVEMPELPKYPVSTSHKLSFAGHCVVDFDNEIRLIDANGNHLSARLRGDGLIHIDYGGGYWIAMRPIDRARLFMTESRTFLCDSENRIVSLLPQIVLPIRIFSGINYICHI